MAGSGLRTPTLLDSITTSKRRMMSATSSAWAGERDMPGPSPTARTLLVMQPTFIRSLMRSRATTISGITSPDRQARTRLPSTA